MITFLATFIAQLSVPCLGWSVTPNLHSNRIRKASSSRLHSEIVDADYERVESSATEDNDEDVQENSQDKKSDDNPPSLLDIALGSDPDFDWNETPVHFVYGEDYIDTKLAFMATLDGVEYGIGVPYEHAVAMTLENKDGSVEYLNPDDGDDNEELLNIMATQVHDHLGTDLKLKRTPRILTISGPLDKYTDNWQENMFPSATPEELMDESDEDLADFHEFMRKEFGDAEYDKVLKDSETAEVSKELAALFEIPGMGSNTDDKKGIEEMLESMFVDPDKQMDDMMEEFGKDINHEGVALKLISYIMPGGKRYSLVKLLKPYILVGKYTNEKDDILFELLSPEEERLMIPRLEQVCRGDFEKAGLVEKKP